MIAYLNYATDCGPWVSLLPACKTVSWAQAMNDINFAGPAVEMEMANFKACLQCKADGSVAIPFYDDYSEAIRRAFDSPEHLKQGCSKVSLYIKEIPGNLAYEVYTDVHVIWGELREDATYSEHDEEGSFNGDIHYNSDVLIYECLKQNKDAINAIARLAFIPMMERWVKSGEFKEAFERLKEYYNL